MLVIDRKLSFKWESFGFLWLIMSCVRPGVERSRRCLELQIELLVFLVFVHYDSCFAH